MRCCRIILWAWLLALALAACSGAPTGDEVIAAAKPGDEIAFDVVKIDDAVLTTVLAHPAPAFPQRFRKYTPPPELKLAVGDTVAVGIWESASNGLFGNSLTELSFSAGAASKLFTEGPTTLGGVPTLPIGMGPTPEVLALLFGASAAQDFAASGLISEGPDIIGRLGAAGALGPRGGGAAAGLGGAGGLDLAGAGARRGLGGAAAGLAASRPDEGGSRRLQQLVDMARQSGRPGTRIPDQHVGPDGAISVPYAGRIKVVGKTPSEVERRIEELLGPKALDPQALVVVRRSAVNSVTVGGEIIGGRRIPLTGGGDRLLQVIAAAGGARAPVSETFVRLSRDGVTATVPLATLISDPEQDIFAEPGDVLTLVRQPKTFTVFGAVGRSAVGLNSAIEFLSARLSLAEALARAGGLVDERADPRYVFLFRYEPVSVVKALGQPIASGARDGLSPIAYRLDLKDAKSYLLAKRFPVHDKDIIFVANAKAVPLYYFFQTLSQITGPITNTLAVCSTTSC